MNPMKLSPKKLLHSKWTAVNPIKKQKHFMIVDVEFDENNIVIHCEIQAIMSKQNTSINWRDLKDDKQWLQGWQ
ncbi:TIGR02450 family Trp-rich protein [Glaciecola sp. 2405UD65-10]|jgi:tryptophan-rich hypothetical protein|uniref:TIGR02450 family Trp-rich protein n=1 Tax=Glaciecola sp. 2405UD65-10 TaxID=3397244 RepID=UPI003B5BC28E